MKDDATPAENDTAKEYYSGVPWVYVSREEAQRHPKGKPGAVLIAIGFYFIAMGCIRGWVSVSAGEPFLVIILNSLWPILTGLGLIFAVPWSVFMAGVSAGLTLWVLIRNLGGDQSLFYLAEMVISAGILFYLVEGDRPNLVYRHRYRKYSAAEGGAPREL